MEYDEIIAELIDKRERLDAAIEALTGTKPPPSPRVTRSKNKRTAKNNWRPSEETMNAVLDVLMDEGRPTRTDKIAERTGYSRETVRRALNVLRTDQAVRVTGVDSSTRGAPKMYAAMSHNGSGS